MTFLFRAEALDSHRNDLAGSIRLAVPLSDRLILLFLLSALAMSVAVMFLGHYTRRVRSSGALVPAAGLIDVAAQSNGTIEKIFVDQGSSVQAGDPLVVVSSERTSSLYGEAAGAVSNELRLQRTKLEADLAGVDKLESERSMMIRQSIAALQAQLAQMDAQLLIQNRLVGSSTKMLEKIRPLQEKGNISALQLQQLETAALDAEVQVKATTRQRLAYIQQIDELRRQLAQLPLVMSTQRHDLERKRSEIEESLAQNELQRETVLRAPRDGLISIFSTKLGQPVATGETLLSISPKDSPLEALLFVPSRAVGFMKVGDTVRVRYESFPYQKFGSKAGRVRSISNSPIGTNEIARLTGRASTEPAYRVDVELGDQSILAYGRAIGLRAGMSLDADVMVDRRRLIEWIFEPLYGARERLTDSGTDSN